MQNGILNPRRTGTVTTLLLIAVILVTFGMLAPCAAHAQTSASAPVNHDKHTLKSRALQIVEAPTPPATVALQSGVPVDGSMADSSPNGVVFETQYTIQVPENATLLRIELFGNTDLDLYARHGSRVMVQDGVAIADFDSATEAHYESIFVSPQTSPKLQGGLYYLMLVNYGPGPVTFKITATVSSPQTCPYTLTPTSQSFGAAGGSGSLELVTQSGCNWRARSNANWITVSAGANGSASARVKYAVLANNRTSPRTGALSIGNQTFTITQAGGSGGDGTTETLALDDGTQEGGMGWHGDIFLNRLTPTGYPATLRTLRIFFRKFDNFPSPSGAQIKLLVFGSPANPADPLPRLFEQSVTIPAIALTGEWIDFPLANGPTVESGDLYVGFQAPNPIGGVGACLDLSSSDHFRSLFSPDNGALYYGLYPRPGANETSMNLMIRAVVTVGKVVSVSAASYSENGLAREAIAAAFGAGLATTVMTAQGTPNCPTCPSMELAGTKVIVKDSDGNERPAPLFFVSPKQINYLIPKESASGPAIVTVTSGDGAVSSGTLQIADVAPGLFAANGDGQGVPAALAMRVRANDAPSYEMVAQFDEAQKRFVPRPLDLSSSAEEVYLILFGTGLRYRQPNSIVSVRISGTEAPVLYAGAQGSFLGLDQVNVRLPRNLNGRGEVDLVLSVDGKPANTVKLNIK